MPEEPEAIEVVADRARRRALWAFGLAAIVVAHMDGHTFAGANVAGLIWLVTFVGGLQWLVLAALHRSWSPSGFPLRAFGLVASTLLVSLCITEWQAAISRERGDTLARELARFHATHGRWPEGLHELQPSGLPREAAITAMGALSTVRFHYYVYADGKDYSLSFATLGIGGQSRGADGVWRRG